MTIGIKLLTGLGLAALTALPASALPLARPTALFSGADLIPVAQGCGPGWWRGPWGHCRDTPYSGPMPGGGWAYNVPPAYGYFGNGCSPGWWRGPWGHCRDTPYHGRLPDGGWK
ncbi:GCG_CRPN prefix-to-repeats domain-containing protein [Bradyrhizobium canariense]|uniref:Uncharacterized protein n=1 Tax=Bradyrhizobium canariense TaxID=255045 RepID=A0A1H1WND9_9BRAD|nr:hypothetical protein [Bradyrhizobium canariense]SDS98643.1 hypothetical protein SAMN05444158_3935 [Bradyrhizobium canariense]